MISFTPFEKNNTLDFTSPGRMAFLYGPNGAGNISLVQVLQGERVEYEGFSYIEPASIFHVISDQNSWSIVQYDCGDFLLRDQIHR